jgi:alanine racemase
VNQPQRALARVDLDAVRANCEQLKSRLAGGAALCAVVKADAYGHGMEECARAALSGGAGWLAVATAGEADRLRQAQVDCRLLVMGALTTADLTVAVDARAEVVLWDPDFLPALTGAAGDRSLPVHVKLDTGMGRLGTRDQRTAEHLVSEVAGADGLEVAGVMTHFATADELDDDHFPAQLERFGEFATDVQQRHPRVVRHAANSAATFRDAEAQLDLVRCGIAVYGLDPFGEDPAARGLQPALSLTSYVAMVKRFEPGDTAGYGRRWTPGEPTDVAVVPIGYGDGVRRALTNNCDVLIGGERRPLVGTVSMDNLTVDLGAGTDVRVGDEVVLLGSQGGERILAEEMAARLDTINYEITCGLGPRVPRVYSQA